MANEKHIKFIVKTIKDILKDKNSFCCYYSEYTKKRIKFADIVKKDYINLKFKGSKVYYKKYFDFQKEIEKRIGGYLKGLCVFVLDGIFYQEGYYIISIKKETHKRINHIKSVFIYHFTHKKNTHNILKNGLIVNKEINNFNYECRFKTIKGIWFYNRLDNISSCLINDNLNEFDVFKVETKNLKNKFYDDINTYYKVEGSQIKTYEKIDKENLILLTKKERQQIKFTS